MRNKRSIFAGAVFLGITTAFLYGFRTAQLRTFPYFYIERVERYLQFETLYRDNNRDILSRLLVGRPLSDIVFIGDSHAQYGDWAHLIDNPNITNLGIAGDSSTDLLKRINEYPISDRTVVVSIGTNDIDAFNESITARNIQQISDHFVSSRNRLNFLLPPLTLNAEKNGVLKKITAIVTKNCTLPRCRLIDPNSVVSNGDNRDPATALDIVHLNQNGYEKVGPLVRAVVQQ